jgi:tetratricopeptide (TPR) repeat protein
VDEGDLETAATALRMFRELDHAHGAGQIHADVQAYIESELSRLLGGRPANDTLRTRLDTLAAGFFELCGYQAVDIGADGLAQRRYLRALTLSQNAGNRVYGGYLLAVSLAHLALHRDQPEQALRLVQAAVHGVGDTASPTVRAAFHAVLARAYARMGQGKECTSALRASETQLTRSRPDDEPPWIEYFTPAYLADEVAHCFYDLGDYTLAQQHVAEAITGLAPSHLRRLAIDAALLASSLAAAGEVEHACAVGRQAVDHAARTNSARCTQRIASMRVELEPYLAEPDVRELIDYIRHAVPAAA